MSIVKLSGYAILRDMSEITTPPVDTKSMIHRLEALIRDIPDFPKPGVLFKDITPLLADSAGLALAVELMANPLRNP